MTAPRTDALVVAGVVLAFVALWWAFLPWWGVFYLALGLLLAAFEIAARRRTGMTLSQQFWAFSQQHTVAALVLLSSLPLVIALLVWHLAVKMF